MFQFNWEAGECDNGLVTIEPSSLQAVTILSR
jgi:hypothetical protein